MEETKEPFQVNFENYMESADLEQLGHLESKKTFFQIKLEKRIKMVNAFIFAGEFDKIRHKPSNPAFKEERVIEKLLQASEFSIYDPQITSNLLGHEGTQGDLQCLLSSLSKIKGIGQDRHKEDQQ
eukprot:TRINITY_DN10127_c0_g1_i2.p1 TRINITY_DN10127_c0_g1~~TRINITY_DN10127_c0_g1_i2.p1  ORF type:complete len:126 (-),score=28.29 TRINITY_DN10127_c0_g1_i2:32-409(-)